MSAKKILNTYYNISVGIEPDVKDRNLTMATILYLQDNKFSDKEIFNILKTIGKPAITGLDLPDELWKDNLTEKGVYYYNDILHIQSKAPVWNPKTFEVVSSPFFMEMKINFTIYDLLNYYYSECRVPIGLRDEKKDIGAFKHLLKKYNNLKAPALDYVLMLIKLMSKDIDVEFCADVFELNNYAKEAYSILETIVEESILNKQNNIIWRTYND